MDLTPANIQALRTTFNRDFRNAYDETPVFYPRISTTVTSSSKQNDYGWMAGLPDMREWLGPRVVHNLITHSYAIKNRTWELTFGVSREDIEDDNLGIYSNMAEAHGEAARKKPDQLMVDLLKNGQSVLAFDGQNFFDTDHPVALKDASKGTYSNYSASGLALDQTNVFVVRSRMMGYKGDSGRPLGIIPDLCVIPPALESDAMDVFVVEKSASGATNKSFRMMDILVIPELSGEDDTWYALATNRRIRPFIFQTRRPINFQAKNRIDDDVVLEENEVRFYADSRNNAGYSLPFLAHKAAA